MLIYFATALGDAIYPLYVLVGLRVLATYQQQPTATIVPFLLGPAYIFTAQTSDRIGMPGFDQPAQWGLLLGSLGFGVVAIWASAARQREIDVLQIELRRERATRAARDGELERTTNDIRARMRDLHAFEEGLRVITSTLSLDEVLSQIVDSTVQMLGPARVHGMTLSLFHGDTIEHRSLDARWRGGLRLGRARWLGARCNRRHR